MLQEAVFGDSAAGSLKMAQTFGKGDAPDGPIGVIFSPEDGEEPSQEEMEKFREKAEEQRRRAWERAAPLGGSAQDVHSFHLALSVGDISGNGLDENRAQALHRLFSLYPEERAYPPVAQELLEQAQENLRSLCSRAGRDGIRVWYSSQPDEFCGLCWLMERLETAGYDGPVSLVKLPGWKPREDGCVEEISHWGEVGPEDWGRYARQTQPASSALQSFLAARWRELQQENYPLRAVVNGRLVSVPEDFYDDFLRREISAMPEEFQEAVLIGRTLGKYQLGVGDCWLALRVEEMIARGELVAVTQPPKDMPAYRRVLRKKADQ